GMFACLSRVGRGFMVVVLGGFVVVFAVIVTILTLALARLPHLFGGVVRVACLVVVARLVPFAGLVLFVRLIVVVTALFAAGRRGTCQDVTGLMQGHTRSDRGHEGEGKHDQYQMCHEVPPSDGVTAAGRITLLAQSSK